MEVIIAVKVLLTFTYGISLDQWYNLGLIYREIELYKKLMGNSIDFTFLTYGDNKDLGYSKLLGKIKIIPVLNYIKSKDGKVQFLKSLFLPFKFKERFMEVDLIKTNQMDGSLIACIAKLLFRKKLIIRCGFEKFRFFLFKEKQKKRKNYFKYLLKYIWIYFLEFISYKIADGIILTSKLDIDFIINKFNLEKKRIWIRHFYNYIDVDLFKPLNLEKKEKHVLFIGRLNEQKNLFNLLQAFKKLDGFTLDIIGEGHLKEKLKEKSEEYRIKINFLERFPNNKIPEILNQYQIFILPSHFEGNPKVLLEAMSCGISCIGTDVYGINNIIIHKKNGYLCKTNAKSIRNAILSLYNQRDLRENIGKNARNFILENCTLETIANKEYKFYREILNG